MFSVAHTADSGGCTMTVLAAVMFGIMLQCSLCVGGREGYVLQCVAMNCVCSHALLV